MSSKIKPIKRKKQIVLVSLFSFCSFLVFGCNQAFEPLQPNDTSPFAMYGYLDASADTQWVRIQPLRDQLAPLHEVPEMHVTLEHIQSGITVVMHDSLFTVNEGNTAINVWTTMDIEPEQTYRIRAERPDGAASQVTVSTPADFPTPVLWAFGIQRIRAYIFLKEIENVADAVIVWKVGPEFHFIPYRNHLDPHSAPAGFDYRIFYSAYDDVDIIFPSDPPNITNLLESLDPRYPDVRRQLFVVSGGPEWREEIGSLSDFDYSIPQNLSNVENGIGYVVGVLSKTLPFEACADFEQNFIPCSLEDPMWK